MGRSIEPYGTAFIAGIVLGFCVGVYRLRQSRISWKIALQFEVALTLAGLGGAKLYSLLERMNWRGFEWEAANGWRYPGGIVAVSIAVLFLSLRERSSAHVRKIADAVVPPTGLAMAVIRVGCFLGGCCHGTPTELPWAIRWPPGSPAFKAQISSELIRPDAVASLPVHPLQIYFGLWSLIIGAGILLFDRRKAYDGQTALWFVLLDQGGKSILESFRFPYHADLQIVSASLVAIAGFLLLRAQLATAPDLSFFPQSFREGE